MKPSRFLSLFEILIKILRVSPILLKSTSYFIKKGLKIGSKYGIIIYLHKKEVNMQVQEYLFRSPYPSRIQVGTPETFSQNHEKAVKEGTNVENKKIQTNIKNAEVKSQTKDIKLTADTNKLDLYA